MECRTDGRLEVSKVGVVKVQSRAVVEEGKEKGKQMEG